MAHPSFVRVEVRCGACSEILHWCVRVDRNVPEPLRCSPGGGVGSGGGSGIRCPKCNRTCFDSPGALERAVNKEVQGGWGRHQKTGAVVLEC